MPTERRRYFGWFGGIPRLIAECDNGTRYVVYDGGSMVEVEPSNVTEIPTAEWLRQNEADFRELLEACHTLAHTEPDQRESSEAWAVMRDVVDRRWKPTTY